MNAGIELLREVGAVPMGEAKLVARLVRINGRDCGDLRLYCLNSTGEMVPTRRGLALGIERIPDAAALFAKLAEAAEAAKQDGE